MKGITYTNQRNQTYYLCEVTQKSGKTRFVFSREPRGTPVTQMPAGYESAENVNGQVSLRKVRTSPISEAEVESVRLALRRHPHLSSYRVEAKNDAVVIHEAEGGVELQDMFRKMGLPFSPRAGFEMWHRYTPVFRFVLADPQERIFEAERMCYRGSLEGWLSLHAFGSLDVLARRYLKHLGKESFFELC